MRYIPGIALGWIFLSAACFAQSVQDIRADIDKGEYRPALQKVNRALKDANANDDLRCDLLTLRGEALVQLRQKSAALDAFRAAWRAAPPDADLSRSMTARSMVELLSGVDGWSVRPRGGTAIDIVPPESRKKAMAALFEQKLNELRPDLESARDATTLAPMIDLMPDIGALMALEFGATDGLESMTPIIQSLGERSRDLIGRELDRLAMRVNAIEDAASEMYFFDNTGIPARRGLHSDEAAELVKMQDYLEPITQAGEEGRRINRRLGGTGESWDDVLLRASEIRSRARYVVNSQGPTVLPRR